MPSGTTKILTGVWASGPSNAFAVGDSGVVLHYDGSAWRAMASGTKRVLLDVWGRSATEVYASGRGGLVLRYDGASWAPVAGAPFDNLTSLWGTSDHLYTTGMVGRVFRDP
jgi:photosystem II stability/assembly factor-like uncharacterized protein